MNSLVYIWDGSWCFFWSKISKLWIVWSMSFFYLVANSCVSVIFCEKKKSWRSQERRKAPSLSIILNLAPVCLGVYLYTSGRLSFEHNSTLPSTEDPKVYILSTLYTMSNKGLACLPQQQLRERQYNVIQVCSNQLIGLLACSFAEPSIINAPNAGGVRLRLSIVVHSIDSLHASGSIPPLLL